MQTNHTGGTVTAVLIATAAMVLGSCSPEAGTADSKSTTLQQPSETSRRSAPAATTSESSATTGVAEPTSAELDDEGQRAAAEAVDQFWAMLDEVSQDPGVEVQELAKVARGQALAQWVSNIQGRRDRGSVQDGRTSVTVTDVRTITEGERYEVTACLDFSAVTFNGASPDRGELGDMQEITYVVRPDVISEGELFVTDDPLEYVPCGS